MSLLGIVPWLLDKLIRFASKPKLTVLLSESDSLSWTVKVPQEATETRVNHTRVGVRNEGKVAAQGVQVMLRFPENFVREVAETTGSFGFPEEEGLWKKYQQGNELVLEFAGDKSVPPKDEVQIGNLRIPLTGHKVVSDQFHCSSKVSANNAKPVESHMILTVERAIDRE